MVAAGSLLALLLIGYILNGLWSARSRAPGAHSGDGDAPETVPSFAENAHGLSSSDIDREASRGGMGLTGIGAIGPAPGRVPCEDAMGAGLFEVTGTARAPDGTTVAYITDFDPDSDRLILDFDGGPDEAPVIGLDPDSSPGDMLVLANDVPVTALAGVEALDVCAIELRMSVDHGPRHVDGGGSGSDVALEPSEAIVERMTDLEDTGDRIEVALDPGPSPAPAITLPTEGEGAGTQVILEGEAILHADAPAAMDPAATEKRDAARGPSAESA